MLAIDTNVIVRYLVGDDRRQAARARDIIDANDVFVTATVLLETDWVLRSAYRFAREDSNTALRAFCGLPTVGVDRPEIVVRALDWSDGGMDLADALHLSASSHCNALISFDTDLAKIAKKLSAGDVRQP